MSSIFSITTEGEIATTTAAKTIIALFAATTVKPKLVEWGISFDGIVANDAPIQVWLRRMTVDDGTRTTTVTEAQVSDPDNPTSNAVGRFNYTAEGTKSDRIAGYQVHPQTGIVVQYPLGREPGLDNATANGICIEVTAGVTVNAIAYMMWEE